MTAVTAAALVATLNAVPIAHASPQNSSTSRVKNTHEPRQTKNQIRDDDGDVVMTEEPQQIRRSGSPTRESDYGTFMDVDGPRGTKRLRGATLDIDANIERVKERAARDLAVTREYARARLENQSERTKQAEPLLAHWVKEPFNYHREANAKDAMGALLTNANEGFLLFSEPDDPSQIYHFVYVRKTKNWKGHTWEWLPIYFNAPRDELPAKGELLNPGDDDGIQHWVNEHAGRVAWSTNVKATLAALHMLRDLRAARNN